MSSVSIETNPDSGKRKHVSNFISGNDNNVILLTKNNYSLCTCYVTNIIA